MVLGVVLANLRKSRSRARQASNVSVGYYLDYSNGGRPISMVDRTTPRASDPELRQRKKASWALVRAPHSLLLLERVGSWAASSSHCFGVPTRRDSTLELRVKLHLLSLKLLSSDIVITMTREVAETRGGGRIPFLQKLFLPKEAI